MLNQHPDIFIPSFREPSFFATDLMKEEDESKGEKHFVVRKMSKYLSLYEGAKNEKAIGDMSTCYFFSKEAPKNIQIFNPNAKIIIMLREPISWLLSVYHQISRSHEYSYDSFEDFLNGKKHFHLKKKIPRLYFGDYLIKTNYPLFLRRYFRVFPKKNIRIFFYDDFKRDPVKICKEIYSFLNVDPSFNPQVLYANVSKLPRRKLKKIVDLGPVIFFRRASKSLVPPKIWGLLRFVYEKIVFMDRKEIIREPFYSKLKRELKPNVESLQRFLIGNKIKRDVLLLWGYRD